MIKMKGIGYRLSSFSKGNRQDMQHMHAATYCGYHVKLKKQEPEKVFANYILN
jgi:hypothetical protein